MRRAARTDANHREIVAALKRAGCMVIDASRVGGGVPDLCVGIRGRWTWLEVKRKHVRGQVAPSDARLSATQVAWHAEASARNAGPVRVVHDVPEALAAVGLA